MAKKVTTLFIRDSSINLLVMKGNQVDKWASLPLESGLVSQGLVLNEVEVANKVKELFGLARVRPGAVIAGLSGLDSLYRILTLPELPEAILPEAVRREASRAMPISLDEVYISYQPVPSPTRGETRIFLTAFPRNIADALLRTLREASLDPYLIDLAPLALCRIPDEPRAIIVNARLEHLGIMIIADRLPQVIRRLSLPSEAESLSEKMPAITDEFNRTVAFYNSSHLEKPIDSTVPVFVCGDLVEASENWQLLVGSLESPVSPLTPPIEYPEGFNLGDFMVNVGLAFKELLTEKDEANFSIVNFNALPQVRRPIVIPREKIFISVGIAAGIALLAFMGFLVYNSSAHNTELRSQLELTEENIILQREEVASLGTQTQSAEAQIESVKTQLESTEATVDVFNTTLTSLEETREAANEDLRQIVEALPSSVNLTEVDYKGSSVTVRGIAPDEHTIFQYSRLLRSEVRFSAVIISSIEEYFKTIEGEETQLYKFELALK